MGVASSLHLLALSSSHISRKTPLSTLTHQEEPGTTIMASEASRVVSSGIHKLQQTLGGGPGSKASDLASVTRDYNDSNARITTDYGVLQSNTGKYIHVAICSSH